MQQVLIALRALVIATVVTGLAYPLVTLGVAGYAFPVAAGGSLAQTENVIRGSWIIGQSFTSEHYFHGRPSAAGDGYDAVCSGASNLAATNAEWVKFVEERAREWQRKAHRSDPVPIELVTASGSGLDPHLSLQATRYQIPMVARARGIPEPLLEDLVQKSLEPRALGVLGEPKVNVLRLNLTLDDATARVLPTG